MFDVGLFISLLNVSARSSCNFLADLRCVGLLLTTGIIWNLLGDNGTLPNNALSFTGLSHVFLYPAIRLSNDRGLWFGGSVMEIFFPMGEAIFGPDTIVRRLLGDTGTP